MISMNREKLGAIRSLLLVSLLAIALAVATATSALAGYSGFNNTGSMNTARVFHTATRLANG